LGRHGNIAIREKLPALGKSLITIIVLSNVGKLAILSKIEFWSEFWQRGEFETKMIGVGFRVFRDRSGQSLNSPTDLLSVES
jgi:hypothetical protein